MSILTNAHLVLEGEVVHGTLTIVDGRIADIQPGLSRHPAAMDLEGDLLIPGVVDVHTDNLERQGAAARQCALALALGLPQP
jgi:alpha-D-ribose 1-methylphosphonate 5-triphosphate diphosphatase